MPHYYHNIFVRSIVCGVSIFALAGCKGTVETKDANLAQLETRSGIAAGQGSTASVLTPSDTQVNMAVEEEVCNVTLKAWRKATAGDEKGAMADLEALDKKHPNVSNVQMMMGQVADHFGHNKEALEHFRRSAKGNEYSMMRMYKLADSLRANAKYDEAIPIFRKILKGSESFEPALKQPFELGLADCLLHQDAHSKEGLELLEQSLKDNPKDQAAVKLKKEFAGK